MAGVEVAEDFLVRGLSLVLEVVMLPMSCDTLTVEVEAVSWEWAEEGEIVQEVA